MTVQHILLITFSFLPFAVCLFWFACFVIQCDKADQPKRFFMAYIGTCTVLYLSHGLYFTNGLPYELECLWTFCSLSVYPLFYGYLCRLTASDYRVGQLLPWLLPGAAVAVAKYEFPDAGIDRVRLLLFACQIVAVCYFGIRKLNAFDRKLQSVYADTEGRDTTAVHHLLVAIIIVSALSGLANSVGKQFFGESLWLLVPVSVAFTVMLFALSYICFNRQFTVDQFDLEDAAEEALPVMPMSGDTELIGSKIEAVMVGQQYFMKKDLKITDLAKAIGSNRTYVSNYINRTYHCSFSDYTNRMRVEHAQQLLAATTGSKKLSQIAEESGFASEQSFYRNFKKFAGMPPAEWQSKAISTP